MKLLTTHCMHQAEQKGKEGSSGSRTVPSEGTTWKAGLDGSHPGRMQPRGSQQNPHTTANTKHKTSALAILNEQTSQYQIK